METKSICSFHRKSCSGSSDGAVWTPTPKFFRCHGTGGGGGRERELMYSTRVLSRAGEPITPGRP